MKETRKKLIEDIYNLMGKTLKLPLSNRGVYYTNNKLIEIRDYLITNLRKDHRRY